MNKYPVYIPSKNRADLCKTAKCLIADKVDFKIVVEPAQFKSYADIYGKDQLLKLPRNDMRLLGARLWIREHSIKKGFDRHWQFDDNIDRFLRLNRGKRIPINAGLAMKIVEDFTDRYTNIGISGFNYAMFVLNHTLTPMYINCHVYSACLINNRMPYKWRLIYNDDTDLCLQVLTNGMCTVAFNAVMAKKLPTMVMKGGNTEDLYRGEGRLKMARTLEKMWPDLVETRWRFGRPQHVIKNNWRQFTQKLERRKDIDWDNLKPDRIKLTAVKEIKSEALKQFYLENKAK